MLLVGNIVISQLLLSRELEIESNRLGKATVNYVLALGEKDSLLNKNKDHNERVNSVVELTNYANKIDTLLINNNQLSLDLLENHKRLTKNTKLVITIFVFGGLFILLSVSGL